MAALFSEQPETAPATEPLSVAKSVHEARRLRRAGDVDGALAVLAGMDATKAEPHQARWGLHRVEAVGEAGGSATWT